MINNYNTQLQLYILSIKGCHLHMCRATCCHRILRRLSITTGCCVACGNAASWVAMKTALPQAGQQIFKHQYIMWAFFDVCDATCHRLAIF